MADREYGSGTRHRRADAYKKQQNRWQQPEPPRRVREDDMPKGRATHYNYSSVPLGTRSAGKTGAKRGEPVKQRQPAQRGVSGAQRRPAPPKRPPRRRRARRTALTVLVLLVLAVAATVGIVGYSAYSEIMDVRERGTFYRGVYVNGYELYGATPQEAYDFVLARMRDGISGWKVTINYGSDYSWTIDADTLDLSGSMENVVAQAINEAYAVGRMSSSLLDTYDEVSALKSEPKLIYTSDVTKSDARIDSLIAEIKSIVDTPAQDATWEFMPDRKNPIVVTAETYGKTLNAEALKEEIMQLVNSMQSGSVTVQPETVAPSVKAEDITNSIQCIASFYTEISSHSTEDRNKNIERGCEFFNGKTIKAGAKVSFNSWVGKRNAANGFYPGLEIVYNEYVMGYGGGICQVSSTLYNAVIQAGLKVNKREPHGLKPNYIDMGHDATVTDDGRNDLVFTNTTGADIYVVARVETSGKTKRCLFQFYGRPDPNGYTYSLSSETIETIPIPEATIVQDKKAEYVIYTDQTKEVSKGSEGYVVRTYLLTKDANGNTIDTEELYTDTYKATAPKIYVGVTPRY